jgi:hypothetical protein
MVYGALIPRSPVYDWQYRIFLDHPRIEIEHLRKKSTRSPNNDFSLITSLIRNSLHVDLPFIGNSFDDRLILIHFHPLAMSLDRYHPRVFYSLEKKNALRLPSVEQGKQGHWAQSISRPRIGTMCYHSFVTYSILSQRKSVRSG